MPRPSPATTAPFWKALTGAYTALNNAFSSIKQEIDGLSKVVTTITGSARTLATNAASQSAAMEQMSASAEETETMVQANSTGATKAKTIAENAARIGSQGVEKAQTMVTSVEEIRRLEQITVEIAATSQEQSIGVSQINAALTQLAESGARNKSSSDDLAQVAEQAARSIATVQNALARFKCRNAGPAAMGADQIDFDALPPEIKKQLMSMSKPAGRA
jgi:methyl-accepting chemotaxis protein